jgi:hypothetical protein
MNGVFFLGVCDNLDIYNYLGKPFIIFMGITKIIPIDYVKINRFTSLIVLPFDKIIHVKGKTLTPGRFWFTSRFKKRH